MNIHEYQAKGLLKQFGVGIQEGIVADTPEQAVLAAEELTKQTGTSWWVVKAQIHAGGRGKGSVIGSDQRGVALAKNLESVKTIAKNLLGNTLVTIQTGPQGKVVNKILVAQDVYYPGETETSEFYMSVLLDRTSSKNIIMYSTEGGMDIEDVAHNTPHLIFKEIVEPSVGLQDFQCRKIAFNLGLSGVAFKNMLVFIKALYKAYESTDSAMFEINPVLKTSDNKIIAVDAKVGIDENALYRQKAIAEMRDFQEEDPTEVEAGKFNLNYVKLDGNVGCMVNGAGLAMATMDIIKLSGGDPANFLDVGGTASAETVANAFKIILKDENVKAILINIFGGIVRCDRVANGIVDAYKIIGNIPVPLIVRLQGTNAVEAKEILDKSGLKITGAVGFQEAADLVKLAIA